MGLEIRLVTSRQSSPPNELQQYGTLWPNGDLYLYSDEHLMCVVLLPLTERKSGDSRDCRQCADR